MELDVLAFAAHPDDAEICCGGTLIKLAKLGYLTGICDLTEGELGTRGDPETRKEEARQAADILGLKVRVNLGLPDGAIEPTLENRLEVIKILRRFKPRFVFTSYWRDRHFDHPHASRLVSEACFYSGLRKIATGQEPHWPRMVFFFQHRDEFEPTFLVDITEEFETKMAAIEAFASQFSSGESPEPETFISSSRFRDGLVTRMRYYGLRIGVQYAEPFLVRESLKINDPLAFFGDLDPNRIISLKPR